MNPAAAVSDEEPTPLRNREIGDAWLVALLQHLDDSWPQRVTVVCDEIAQTTGIGAPKASVLFNGLGRWLLEEGLIRGRVAGDQIEDATLTAKAKALLDRPVQDPSGAQSTVREKFDQATTSPAQVGSGILNSGYSEAAGSFLGGMLKSFLS